MAQLIARDEQLNQLNRILQTALGSSLQIVFVTGEAGAGKTVLIDAFIEQVRRRVPELLTAGSKCHAIAGGHQEPYLPFVQILSALVADKEDNALTSGLRRIVTDVAPDWIAVIPIVGDVIAAGTRTIQAAQREFSEQGTGIDTQRRMVQYTNVLNQIAQTVPLLLWIDDLHWSDSATLNLISFLADHASESRIMLIAAYRPTDIIDTPHGQPHPAKPLVSKLKRYQQCLEVPVPNFSRADVESLLSLSRHQFPEPFVERLWRHSGGNALFVRQYITLLHARRLLKRERGSFVLAQSEIEIDIPTTVQAVIEQRLGLIDQDMRRMLSVASVQGERFTSRVLTNLLSTSELDVLEKLNLLARTHHLIHELSSQPLISKVGTQYQFIHVLIQQVLYNNLSAGQRRHLHLTIAQLLETLYGQEASQHAADIAIHFERGGDLARAIEYHLQASRNALDVLALDDALDHAEQHGN